MRFTRLFSFVPVVIWLFTQLAMTGVWSPGTSAIGSAEYAGQSVVICTGDGLVTVFLDENGDLVENPDGSLKAEPCSWCVGFGGPPTLAATTDLLEFVPCDGGLTKFSWGQVHHGAQATVTNARIRAPPVWAMS